VHKPFVEEVKIDGIVLSRLMPGEDLFTSLKKIAKDHGIEREVILSAIGNVKNVVFVNVRLHAGLPVKKEDMMEGEEPGPFELLSLEGNFFPSQEDREPVIHPACNPRYLFRRCHRGASLEGRQYLRRRRLFSEALLNLPYIR